MQERDRGATTRPGGSPPSRALVRAASVVLGITGLASTGVFLVGLSWADRGLTPVQVVILLLVPSAAAVSSGLALRAGPEARVTGGLLLVAVTASLGFGEILASLWLQTLETRASTMLIGTPIAEGTRQLRGRGTRAYPTVPGNVLVDLDVSLEVDATSTHPVASAPGGVTAVLCATAGSVVTFEADRYGFNNPDEAWDQAVDVLLVGDSYTQGVCVPREDQFASHLRAAHSVVNLGNKGSGPLQQLATIREYGWETRAPVVLWVYFEGNDLYDLQGEEGRSWLTAYLSADHAQGLAGSQSSLDRAYRVWIDSVFAEGPRQNQARSAGSPLRAALRLSALRRLARLGPLIPPPPTWALPSILARARDDVASWGGGLHLVYLPAYDRYVSRLGEPYPRRGDLMKATDTLGIPLLDLDPVFRGTGSPRALWEHPRGHLTSQGYSVVAEAILSWLDERAEPGGAGASGPG